MRLHNKVQERRRKLRLDGEVGLGFFSAGDGFGRDDGTLYVQNSSVSIPASVRARRR